jgi:hypothetical protein
VTADGVNAGEGRKLPLGADAEGLIRQAKAALPRHDPFQALLDALLSAVQSIHAVAHAARSVGPLALTNEQMAQLLHKVGVVTERGMAAHANRISAWRAVIMGAIGAGGLLVGAAITSFIDARQLETTRIDTRTVIGTLSMADAGDWAKLIELNPPPRQWTGKQPVVAGDGSNAAWVLLRMEPVPKTQPTERHGGR